jgi:phosphohistidine phosphatase
MPRELLLLRHGKSDWKADADDFHRPLKDRGKRGAQRIGVWLLQQALIPDLVIASPAERALVTAEKCCKVMGIPASRIQPDDRVYLADPERLMEVLADCPAEARRVLLVGHNPGLEMLLEHLADQPPSIPPDGKLLPTATLARLQVSGSWQSLDRGQARLTQVLRASSLPKKFPFPAPDGEESRDRPAYYYTQSSVIPYRVGKNGVEILVVRSSQNKHWVVPKGIAEPGLSLQDSAAKEALEEAGVEGRVLEEPIGSYRCAKWGATCTVTVYPMEVSRELTEQEWEEDHRGREWVAASKAAGMLRQTELGPLVLALEERLNKA